MRSLHNSNTLVLMYARLGTRNISTRVLTAVLIFSIPTLLFVVPLIVYWPGLTAGFVSDDFPFHYIFTFTPQHYFKAFAMIKSGDLYFQVIRPTVFFSFQIDYLLWGADAVGFHMTNFVLHSISSVLLFCLALMLGFRRFAAAVAALVFGLYPAHAEAVIWVSGRFDVLSLTLLLTSFLFWCHARLKNDHRLLTISAVVLFVAMFAKESAAAGALLLPIIDMLLRTRPDVRENKKANWDWRWYLVHFFVVTLVIGFRIWLLGDIGGIDGRAGPTKYTSRSFDHLWNNLVVKDLWMLITPVNREVWGDWHPAMRTSIVATGIAGALALIAAFTGSTIAAVKGDKLRLIRMLAFSAWTVIALLPMLPLAGVDGNLNSARFLYHPSVGLALLIGAVSVTIVELRRPLRHIAIALLAAFLILSTVTLRNQVIIWCEGGDIARKLSATVETHVSCMPNEFDIFMINTPDHWKGAPCGLANFEGYVHWKYGQEWINLWGLKKNPDDIDRYWGIVQDNWARRAVGFVWDDSSGMLRVLPDVEPNHLGRATGDEPVEN